MFLKFIKAEEKANLYSVSRIVAKSSRVCSIYHNEMISKLNESQDNLNNMWIVGIIQFLVATITFLLVLDRFFNSEKTNEIVFIHTKIKKK
jgi:hypothetical protein